ncbi:norbelladine synthase-like [Salvia miltiorrhiza]|uniref:norbelladine synthase-like n=1 Tax=Salvia miltiorrhiza TaxID=226208 RepID=UPI0025AC3A6A|nr:norbelladine synthase-like [Salvia miltiorrhiza]
MSGTISDEKTVNVPASEAWKLYGTLQLAKIVEEALPDLISKIDVVQGDGGAGTVIELFFAPGMEGGLKSYKEKFTVVDEEKRVKETEVVEGGYLDMGFRVYRVRLEVREVEGNEKQCITRATIEYELKEEAAANAAALVSIQPLTAIMQISADYLHRTYNNN